MGSATSINAPTLASIGARSITQMSDLWSFLANFLERRQRELRRILIPRTTANKLEDGTLLWRMSPMTLARRHAR
jgi:hypothetical protein